MSFLFRPSLVAACGEQWYNQKLCQVNDCVVCLGVMQGEFHWHKQDEEDIEQGIVWVGAKGVRVDPVIGDALEG